MSAGDPQAGGPGFRWHQLQAHADEATGDRPGPREAPGGLLGHGGKIYMFGGGTLRYGASSGQGNKQALGSLNDFWRCDPATSTWERLEADDGAVGFDAAATRPCSRILACWQAVGDRFYLFGGLSILGAGWTFTHLNDLWTYEPATARWQLIEADDGSLLTHPDCTSAGKPTTIGGFGSAVVGQSIYVFGGWGHYERPPAVESTVLSRQLWSYDTVARQWTNHTRAAGDGPWPAKRYCPAMTAWAGKLYLWGGRDTQDRDPQFYNDLWQYDPAKSEWTCLQPNDPDDDRRPTARYGMGDAATAGQWYIFGGFGPSDEFAPEEVNGPQLNDLWRYDLDAGDWCEEFPHDGAKDYSARAQRPGVRRVPGMVAHDNSILLFGGLDLASGPDDDGPVIGFNDLWRGC